MISRKSKVQRFDKVIRSGNVGGALTSLYRTIMFGLGITADRYDALMARYIQKALFDTSRKEKAMVRIGLSKELLKESMTWKTFVKGIKFLNVPKFELYLTLWQSTGNMTMHSIAVSSDEYDLDKMDTDERAPGQLGEILAKLYKSVQETLSSTKEESERLMEKYLATYHYKLKKSDKATVRAGLAKELNKGSMTWKTFIKGLTFLDVAKTDLQIVLYHHGNKVTKHQISLVMSDFAEGDMYD